jgi:large subunit ribosomal protein L20
MTRVSRGLSTHKRHKKFIDRAKGFQMWRGTVYKQVRSALFKQAEHAYRGRKLKKRQFRSLWIERINAAARMHDMSYSALMWGLRLHHIALDRKAISELAVQYPTVFTALCEKVRS